MGKDFKTSMAFINTEDAEGQTEPKQEAPKKPRTAKKKQGKEPEDKRTRRVQAVLSPRLYEQLNDIAWKKRQSVNETIIKAVEDYIRRNK